MVLLPPIETTPVLMVRFTERASSRLIDLLKKRLQEEQIIILSEEIDKNQTILSVTTYSQNVQVEAENYGLVKTAALPNIPIGLKKLSQMQTDGILKIEKPFTVACKEEFTATSSSGTNKEEVLSGYDTEGLFTSSDRVRLVKARMETLTVISSNNSNLDLAHELEQQSSLVKKKARNTTIVNSKALLETYQSKYLLDVLREMNFVDTIAPIHIDHLKDKICSACFHSITRNDSVLKAIRDYYGEEIAIYFGMLQFYMSALLFPGLSGLIIFILRKYYTGDTIDECIFTPFHGLITFIWSAAFIKMWSRQECRLSYSWGTYFTESDGSTHLQQRHQFKGELALNPVTGEMTKFYSPTKRRLKYLVSAFVTFLLLSGAFIVMIMSLNLQGYIKDKHEERWGDDLVHPFHFPSLAIYAIKGQIFDSSSSWKCYIPVILHVTVVLIMNAGFKNVATKLTKWENHETTVSYQNSLILKRFFFEAFDAYLILFFLAFYEQDMMKLRMELVSLFHVDTFRRVFMEGVIPYVTQQFFAQNSKQKKTDAIGTQKKTDGLATGTLNESLVNEANKDVYESFDDYIEQVIQFGYVTLFASAYPLAPFIAILANFIEFKLDIFKLTTTCLRPHSVARSSIGIWKLLFRLIGCMSALTNCLIFTFTSMQMYQFLPQYFTVDKTGEHDLKDGNGWVIICIVFGIEHALFLFAILIDLLIPDVPKDVVVKEDRKNHIIFQENQEAFLQKVRSSSVIKK